MKIPFFLLNTFDNKLLNANKFKQFFEYFNRINYDVNASAEKLF